MGVINMKQDYFSGAALLILGERLNFALTRAPKQNEIFKSTATQTVYDAGNLRLHLYSIARSKNTGQNFHRDSEGAKVLGRRCAHNEHYVTEGVTKFGRGIVGWYLTAIN